MVWFVRKAGNSELQFLLIMLLFVRSCCQHHEASADDRALDQEPPHVELARDDSEHQPEYREDEEPWEDDWEEEPRVLEEEEWIPESEGGKLEEGDWDNSDQ
eukprot:3468486-Rhodomonas_salina.2